MNWLTFPQTDSQPGQLHTPLMKSAAASSPEVVLNEEEEEDEDPQKTGSKIATKDSHKSVSFLFLGSMTWQGKVERFVEK